MKGHPVTVDGKPLSTPAGKPFVVPTRALAEAIVGEARLKGGKKQLTQMASTAIDVLSDSAKRGVSTGQLLNYADTDMICYRAGNIPALQREQEERLGPLVAWATHQFGVTLTVTDGLMPVRQPPENRQKLASAIDAYDPWRLAVLSAAVPLLHSLILGLAFCGRTVDAETAFSLSHMEEIYETAQWGEDEEKQRKILDVKEELKSIEQFLLLLH